MNQIPNLGAKIQRIFCITDKTTQFYFICLLKESIVPLV